MIEIREYDIRKADRETLKAMAFRCEQESHDWVNCASIFLRIYQECRWCGQERGEKR